MSVKKNLVLGLGHPLLTDDSLGLYIVEAAEQELTAFRAEVDFKIDYSGAFDILHEMTGYEKVIIVDSICTGKAEPGFCHEWHLSDFPELIQAGLTNWHSVNLPALVSLGRQCGLAMPEEILLYGIEGVEFNQFSEKPSFFITQDKIKNAVNKIKQKLLVWREQAVA